MFFFDKNGFGQKRTVDRGASVSFEEGRMLGSGFLCWIALIIIILSFVGGVSGCNSLKLNRKSCLFSKNREGADTLSNSKEDELVKNASAMSASESPWKSEKMETAPAATNQTAPIAWSAQRPNGGVLFPKTLSAKGPLVVLEPKSIIAPVGSEVVMVASYIGEDNEYLRVNEKLEWGLSGAGIFLTTNPENCCLDGNTKKISDHNLKTTTSAKLWRIHRGTATPTDDISILKGQSWTTVQSGVEGTSSVCVLAPNIDNWQNRTATSVIHWIDAAFLYPRSGIAPVGEQQIFTTTVQRKSSPSEGRMGWTVRYEVLSGPAAGFGPEISPILETQTDQNGQSQVVLSQRENVAGLNKILVKIIRPGSATDSPIVVDQRIINQAWTDNSPFRLRIQGTSSVKVGEVASYQIQVTNLTSFAQNGILTLPIPANGVFVAGTPQPLLENNMAIWIMNDIPANSTQDVTVQIRSQADGGFDIVPTIRRQEATVTPKSGANTTPGGGTAPPVTIPGAELNSGPAATPTPPPTTPPVTTPQTPTSTDPASQTPTLPDTGTAGGVGDSGQVEIRFMRPFPATAKQGEVFDGYFTLINPQNLTVNDIVITSLAPEGVDYVSDEAGVLNRSFVKTTPQPLADIVGRQYRLAYQTQNTGVQEIKIQIMDTSNKVYTSTSIFVTILPVEVTTNKVPAESSEVPPVTFNSSHDTSSDNQNHSENNNSLKIDTTEPESTVNKNPVTSGDAENNGNPAGRNDLDGRTDSGHQADHALKNNVVKPAETKMTSSGSDSVPKSASETETVPDVKSAAKPVTESATASSDEKTQSNAEKKGDKQDSSTESGLSGSELTMENLTILPATLDGKSISIINHPTETGTELPRDSVYQNCPFTYQMMIRNTTENPINGELLELDIEPVEGLYAAEQQPENDVLGKPTVKDGNIIVRPTGTLKPGQDYLLRIELIPKIEGKTNLNIDLIDRRKSSLIGIIQHPVFVHVPLE